MKSIRSSFHSLTVMSILVYPVMAEANVQPRQTPQLDRLASDISLLGYIPAGGELSILAASDYWFGLLSGVRFLPGDSDELVSVLADTSDECRYFGTAPWTPGGDLVLVTAPSSICLPSGLEPAVESGHEVTFKMDGYEYLNDPRTAVGTPDLEVLELIPDSTGQFSFDTPVRGVYWIEVMQQTHSGPSIVLLFPVIAGGTAADIFSGVIKTADSEASCPSEVLNELNLIRRNRGIPALTPSKALDSLATMRAQNLAFSGSFSHFGLNICSLPEILPEDISIYAENIGRGKGYQEAWSMILISPFHLQTCLSEAYNKIGISGAVDSSEYEWQLVLVLVLASGADR